ncbi:ubiquitin-binding SDF ubiquitin ligase complex subunit met30 [Coemansia sp. RSA 1933]|nr:ubiquitin-binding SDF ubiquitin ligase complex subunit met30 [Coemansia sp. RSA 1933]
MTTDSSFYSYINIGHSSSDSNVIAIATDLKTQPDSIIVAGKPDTASHSLITPTEPEDVEMNSSALTPLVPDPNNTAAVASEYPTVSTQAARISGTSSDTEDSRAIRQLALTHEEDNHVDKRSKNTTRGKDISVSGRKRNFSEYSNDTLSSTTPAELEVISLKKYPAFGGRCYRHSAKVYLAECDTKQRELQMSLQALSPAEQSKISSIWQAFASEPAEQRLLILQGIVNLCCIPQLSYLNNVVPQQLRVDYLAALPHDISLLVLSYLDAKALCQASQVSRTWAALANDDKLWHRMCAQHIDKVCKKCGWGLPLLDKMSRRVYEDTARRALRLATSAISPASTDGISVDHHQTQTNYLVSSSLPLSPGFRVASDAGDTTYSPLIHNAAAGVSPNSEETSPRMMTLQNASQHGQNGLPVSSLINPVHADVPLISSVCAPQNAIQLMHQHRQRLTGQSVGMLPLATGVGQRMRNLYSNSVESGNGSDGGSSVNSNAAGSSSRSHAGRSSQRAQRRPWKEIYAERQIIANNWRKFRYHESRIPAHADGILCTQFNDEYIITGSYDSKVHVWDAETFELVSELTGHTMPVRALEFDDCKLFSGSLDGTVRIWNYRDGTCIRALRVFDDGGVISLHQHCGTLVVGGENGTIRVFNIAKMTSFTLTGHTDWVNSVRLYDENTLFSCSDDMLVKRWDLEQRRCVRTYTGHSHHVQSLQLSTKMPPSPSLGPSGPLQQGRRPLQHSALGGGGGSGGGASGEKQTRPFMITGSLDSTMRVWDIETGECLDTIFGHVEGIWSMTFDALRIVSGSNDGTLKVWDTTSHACNFTLQTSQAAINCVAISDTRIIVGDNDGNARGAAHDLNSQEHVKFVNRIHEMITRVNGTMGQSAETQNQESQQQQE